MLERQTLFLFINNIVSTMISTTSTLDTISQDATQPVVMDMLTTMHMIPLSVAMLTAIAQLGMDIIPDQLTISTEEVMSSPT